VSKLTYLAGKVITGKLKHKILKNLRYSAFFSKNLIAVHQAGQLKNTLKLI